MSRFLAIACALAAVLAGSVVLAAPAMADANPICTWATTTGPTFGTNNTGQFCMWGYPFPTRCDRTWAEPIPDSPQDHMEVWVCRPVP